MPISRVRSVTLMIMTLAMPIPPINRLIAARATVTGKICEPMPKQGSLANVYQRTREGGVPGHYRACDSMLASRRVVPVLSDPRYNALFSADPARAVNRK
jgi:hypothetical protein